MSSELIQLHNKYKYSIDIQGMGINRTIMFDCNRGKMISILLGRILEINIRTCRPYIYTVFANKMLL